MKLSLAAAFLAASVIAGPASGAFPDKPIRMVVPFGPGTSTDTTARLIADSLAKKLGQPVVVENKPGAGGAIGIDMVAKAEPDGYTLGFGTVGTFAINKGLYSSLPYDPVTDFTYLAMPGYTPTLLVVGKASPYTSLAALIDDAKQRPDKIAFASAGNGTSGHLAGELLKEMAGVSMLHVPYKQGAQALTDTMSGQVSFMFYHPVVVMPHVKAGELRALAASSSKRSSLAPDVPTISESGYKDFDLTAWYMLAAPANLPDDVRRRLLEASNKAVHDPAVTSALKKQGLEGGPLPEDQLSAFVNDEIKKWAGVINAADARID
ncbi:tripartite tricarboxylate transporter substrate binding protein [Allopusillimonas soli]|uniref:Tripartite tricarboxylate transporter substrate binding protein n=1 Tax=Allopusillimonas soli TaxID=659016 RepID=A0A853F6E9_9BURK|nr:tripartite tricarboxylate transporter substrate binding protein [Allopusillimonas soli]NYT36144.1 tripartite tricarboxylate transporter substrate binding protein [Allopusillimonas soli]TEA76478.1 tripartite tricarboxylate transporter substrate binding protein [Allopusillimonas soli]